MNKKVLSILCVVSLYVGSAHSMNNLELTPEILNGNVLEFIRGNSFNLHKYRCNGGRNILHIAVFDQNIDLFNIIMANSRRLPELINAKDMYGETPLSLALSLTTSESLKIAEDLINKDYYPRITDEFLYNIALNLSCNNSISQQQKQRLFSLLVEKLGLSQEDASFFMNSSKGEILSWAISQVNADAVKCVVLKGKVTITKEHVQQVNDLYNQALQEYDQKISDPSADKRALRDEFNNILKNLEEIFRVLISEYEGDPINTSNMHKKLLDIFDETTDTSIKIGENRMFRRHQSPRRGVFGKSVNRLRRNVDRSGGNAGGYGINRTH